MFCIVKNKYKLFDIQNAQLLNIKYATFMDWSGFSIKEERRDGKLAIWINFKYDSEKYQLIKSIRAKWSTLHKSWYVAANAHYRKLFDLPTIYITDESLSKIHPVNHAAIFRYQDQLTLKMYSSNTLRVYINEFSSYLGDLKKNNVDSISPAQLRAYILYLTKSVKLSENAIHSRLNAIKFYYEQILHNDKIFLEIPRPKKKSLLPRVLSIREIQRLFNAVSNQKHLLMLKLCYGMGLRVSEVANLKVSDINSDRMLVLIEGAKGKKDRYVHLPESILQELREYYKGYKPKVYLFEGQYGDKIAVRTIQAVFHKAMKDAKINKPIGIHGLRHSYATHLLEYGTDISFIKELMGHNQISTTLIYTHVAKPDKKQVQSPLDRMGDK